MALFVAITGCEEPARRVREELQSDQERHRPAEKGRLLVRREVGGRLEIERNRFPKGPGHLLEGASLHRDVEIEASGFPIAVSSFGMAVKRSRRQLHAFRFPGPHRLKQGRSSRRSDACLEA